MFKSILLEAIHGKKVVVLTFDSYEKGVITRRCIPFDYGPSRRFKDGKNRYHFYDLDSPSGNHNLSILEEQILSLVITPEHFDPADYVRWSPAWFVERDWGIYS